MKTEMEQLAENAKVQYAKERAEETAYRFVELFEIEIEKKKKHLRAIVLNMAVCAFYLAFLIISNLWLDFSYEQAKIYLDAIFVLWVFTLAHEGYHAEIWNRAKGQREGFEEVLKRLGMIEEQTIECDCDNCKNNRKKKTKKRSVFASPFKRFKELFERVGGKKNQEAYGI